jgi:uncharacterized protein YktB (UPF0637 family)
MFELLFFIYFPFVNVNSTQHYAKILDKKVSEDMQVLRDKFNLVKSSTNELVEVNSY